MRIQNTIFRGGLGLLLSLCALPLLAQRPEPGAPPAPQSFRIAWPVPPHAPLTDMDACRQWAAAYFRAQLGPNADLQVAHARSTAVSRHVQLVVAVGGIPVQDAAVRLNLDAHGRLRQMLGTVPRLPASFSHSWRHTGAQAAQAVAGSVKSVEAVWFAPDWQPWADHRGVRTGAWVPAWRITASDSTGQLYLHLLADTDLRTLSRRNLNRAHRNAASTTDTLTGRGSVFLPDPLTTARRSYGPPYVHAGGTTNPELDAQLRQVPLPGLTRNPGTGLYELRGPHVWVRDTLPPFTGLPASADGLFHFTRAQPQFRDVMAYYHMDAMQRQVQALGFDLLGRPMRVDASGLATDQSFYVPGADPIILLGTGGVPDAEDADVIVHEYGHALSDAAAPGTNQGQERIGLDEGICDYFAAAYSRERSAFGADLLFNWDGHNEFWAGRTANSSLTRATVNIADIYDIGSLWCATLFEVLEQTDRRTTDALQLQELYFNAPFMGLADAAEALLLSEELRFGGQLRPLVLAALCRRGLLDSGCPPTLAEPDRSARLQVFPNPASAVLQVVPDVPFEYGLVRFRVLDMLGRNLLDGHLPADRLTVPVASLAPGIYVLHLEASAGRRASVRFAVIR